MKRKIKTGLSLVLIGSVAFFLRWFPILKAYLERGNRILLGVDLSLNIGDIWVYLAEMLMGKRGSFLLLKEYGVDSQEKFLIRLPYVYLGHLARVLNLEVETLYLLTAYLLTLGLALVLFRFSSLFFKKLSWRIFSVVLIMLSGPFSLGLSIEAVPFFSISEPHFVLAQICQVLIFCFFLGNGLSGSKKKKVKTLVLIFLVGLILSLIHVFLNWLIILILFFWILIFYNSKEIKEKYLIPLLILVFSSLPMSLYLFFLSKKSLFFQYWLVQNRLASGSPLLYLLELGIFLFLIPFALKLAKRNKKILFLFTWLVVQFLLLYFPVNWQRRLIEGWWITASMLASLGIFYLWIKNKQKTTILKIFCGFMIFLLAFASNFSLVVAESTFSVFGKKNAFASYAEKEAWDFFLSRCDFSKIIFTDFPRGLYLPAKTGCRANLGHPDLTYDFSKRLAEAENIFTGRIKTVELESFFDKNEITYVFSSQGEAEIAGFNKLSNLKLIFENKEFLIYEKVN